MGTVMYKATMTRDQWRAMFLRCEMFAPTHKASLKWLSAAAAELFDVSEVTVNVVDGNIKAKPFGEARPGTDSITLELSRDAVQAIKLVSIGVLTGAGKQAPASLLSRAQLFDSLRQVGPDGALLRLVQKEAQLPDAGADEDELDLGDKKVDLEGKPKES